MRSDAALSTTTQTSVAVADAGAGAGAPALSTSSRIASFAAEPVSKAEQFIRTVEVEEEFATDDNCQPFKLEMTPFTSKKAPGSAFRKAEGSAGDVLVDRFSFESPSKAAAAAFVQTPMVVSRPTAAVSRIKETPIAEANVWR